MTTLRESGDIVDSDNNNTVSPVPSWTAGLARVGGFYQDGDWYNANISRCLLIDTFLQKYECLII